MFRYLSYVAPRDDQVLKVHQRLAPAMLAERSALRISFEAVFQKALAVKEKQLGPQHPDVAKTKVLRKFACRSMHCAHECNLSKHLDTGKHRGGLS